MASFVVKVYGLLSHWHARYGLTVLTRLVCKVSGMFALHIKIYIAPLPCINVPRALLRLVSVAVCICNFTPPNPPAMLPILSASRVLKPDFPMLALVNVFSCWFSCLFSCWFSCLFLLVLVSFPVGSCVFSCWFLCLFSYWFSCLFLLVLVSFPVGSRVFSPIGSRVFSCRFSCLFPVSYTHLTLPTRRTV